MSTSATKPKTGIRWGDVDDVDVDSDKSLTTKEKDAKESKEKENKEPKDSKESKEKENKIPSDGTMKTVVESYINERGQNVKVTRTIRVTKKSIRVNKNVAERRKWKKFGDCEGLAPGPEENVTYLSTELIKLDLRPRKREQEGPSPTPATVGNIVVCRLCGETGHWTLKCPKRSSLGTTKENAREHREPTRSASSESNTGKYVPPSKKAGKDSETSSREEATLRVTNLSEDTTEQDLQDLFRRFGSISRTYLAKDRLTRKSRGFAFINYFNRADAQAAIEKLNGHGYDNLILQVEWAKPREDKPRDGDRPRDGERSRDEKSERRGEDRRDREDRFGRGFRSDRYGGGGGGGGGGDRLGYGRSTPLDRLGPRRGISSTDR